MQLSRFALLLLVLLSRHGFSQGITYVRIHRPVIDERLKLAPKSPAERVNLLKKMFQQAGCLPDKITEQALSDQDLPNVMCTIPGTGEGSIVVAARMDYTERGDRGQVLWGGVAMLPLLAESLNGVVPRHSLVFVGFSGHRGKGASRFLEGSGQPRAMVELNYVGRSPAQYSLAQQSHYMGDRLVDAAAMLRFHSAPVDITPYQILVGRGGIVKVKPVDFDDMNVKPFAEKAVPAMTVFSQDSVPVPGLNQVGGSPVMKPTPDLDHDAYEETYRLMSVYLSLLDRELDKTTSPPGGVLTASAVKPAENPAAPAAPSAEAKPATAEAPEPAAPAALTATASPAPPSPATAPATAPAPPPDIPTFRATSRLVQVDISVTDNKGRPIQGLKAEDFTVLENGKPQPVHAFEAHVSATPETVESAPTPVPLPPQTYTNKTQPVADETINILLFDLLNTPDGDQAYARKQMIQFLRNLPPGRRVALFALTTRLQMVQGFTGSSDTLVKAAEAMLRSKSPILSSANDLVQAKADVDFMASLIAPSLPAGADPNAGTALTNDFQQRMKQAASDEAAGRNNIRVGFTLSALDGIARAVSAYPGRKNLVWLSGSFPIRIRRDDSGFDPGRNQSSYEEAVRSTTTLLATSRIAVFAVDIRGMQTTGISIDTSTAQSNSLADTSGGFASTLASQSGARFDEDQSMQDVAFQTGGEAFTGTNDLKGAITRSVEDGSSYYTVAYTPTDTGNKIEFRKIDVKLNHGGTKLFYRRGYYWTPPPREPVKESQVHALALAMQPGMPPSTMLLLTAKVQPPDAGTDKVKIDYQIDAGGVQFTDTADQKKTAILDCMAVAFDAKGDDVAHAANTMQASVVPAQYASVLRDGMPMHQELALAPGSYTLRLGVFDRASQKVGTIDVPLVVGDVTAKK